MMFQLILLCSMFAASSCLAADLSWKIGDKTLVPQAGEMVAVPYDFYQRAFVGTKTVKPFARENIAFGYRFRGLSDWASEPS